VPSASARQSTGWPARCAVDRVRERRGERAGRAPAAQPTPHLALGTNAIETLSIWRTPTSALAY
jgi:hypothetical protein